MRSPCIRRDEIVNLFNTNLKGATAHTGVEPWAQNDCNELPARHDNKPSHVGEVH